MEYISNYNSGVNFVMQPLENPYLSGFLKMFLVLYGALAAPKLPPSVLAWFEYTPFRIAFLALIIWSSSKDPALSILLATAFFATINTINGKKPFEKFSDLRQ